MPYSLDQPARTLTACKMATRENLETAYRELLKRYGLPLPGGPPMSRHLLERLITAQITASTPESGWTEMPRAWVEEVSARLSVSHGDLGQTIRDLSDEIEIALALLKLPLLAPVFTGEFPTGKFNAGAYVVDGGYLALLNTGLMRLIFNAAKILFQRVRFVDEDDAATLPGANRFHSVLPSFEHSSRLLGELILRYLYFQEPACEEILPLPPMDRSHLFGTLVRDTERFVLAHEYGHVVAAHLQSPRHILASTIVGNVEINEMSWLHEREADNIACLVMLASTTTTEAMLAAVLEDGNARKTLAVQSAVAGTLFLFALGESVDQVCVALRGLRNIPATSTHPPYSMRATAAYEFYAQRLPPHAFGLAQTYLTLLRHMLETAIPQLGQIAQELFDSQP